MRALALVLVLLAGLPARGDEIILEDKGQRVRGGASAEVGSHLGWGGVTMRLEGRAGAQLTPTLSVFGVFGAGFTPPTKNQSTGRNSATAPQSSWLP